MYRVWRIAQDGKYCCLAVVAVKSGGAILKYPPLSLSRSRQNTDGESKSGLGIQSQLMGFRKKGGQQIIFTTYQHMKSIITGVKLSPSRIAAV